MDTKTRKCNITKDGIGALADYVRVNICKFFELKVSDGEKYYCPIHFPETGKSGTKWLLDAVEHQMQNRDHHFEYMFVPDAATFSGRGFPGSAKFSDARFVTSADFTSTSFGEETVFDGATFERGANFNGAKFASLAAFRKTAFLAEVGFSGASFAGDAWFEEAIFDEVARFRDALFKSNVSFSKAVFRRGPDFTAARFDGVAEFNMTEFPDGGNMSSTQFNSQLHFFSAKLNKDIGFTPASFADNVFFNFSEIDSNCVLRFDRSNFLGSLSFQRSEIRGHLYFEGGDHICLERGSQVKRGCTNCFPSEKSRINFDNARISDPTKILFHSVRLQPNWFVNQDGVQRMRFTNCSFRNHDGGRIDLVKEAESIKSFGLSEPYQLLRKTLWQLAQNFEEGMSFTRASWIRWLAHESKRLDPESPKNNRPWSLHWWYKNLSGYGESVRRASVVLFTALFLFGCFYNSPFASFHSDTSASSTAGNTKVESVYKMNNAEGFLYSINTGALQKPEPKAANTLTKSVVVFEMLFIPLQFALLALAIRRRFMR